MTETKTDVLDQIKAQEKRIKARLLLKQIIVLKKLARDILEAKERTNLILEDVGVKEEDAKRIIDFINSHDDVQLSDQDKIELKDEIKSKGKEKRQDIQKEEEKHVNEGVITTGLYYTNAVGGSNITAGTSGTTGDAWTLTAGSSSVNVNL